MAALNRPGAAPLAGGGGGAARPFRMRSARRAPGGGSAARPGVQRGAAAPAPGGSSGGRGAAVTATTAAGLPPQPSLGSPRPPGPPGPAALPAGCRQRLPGGARAGPCRAEEPAADARSLLSPVAGAGAAMDDYTKIEKIGEGGCGQPPASCCPAACRGRCALGLRGAAETQRKCSETARRARGARL